MQQSSADLARRFGGVGRLYGAEALPVFQNARICVVGIGGVGSWAAEGLARSSIGHITLIDLDMIAESNVNRQIHALDDEFGKAKVTSMAARIKAINPDCHITEIEEFVSPENLDTTLGAGFDYVIDAIDQARTKAAMIAWCKRHSIPVITSGSAGGQIDPTRIQIADLAHTVQDPLLAKVRALLRKDYGFTRDAKKKFGIPAIYSTEPLRYPANSTCNELAMQTGLNCTGFGSSVCVTAPFGLFAVAEVLKCLSSRA